MIKKFQKSNTEYLILKNIQMEVSKAELKSVLHIRLQMDRPTVLLICINDLVTKQPGEAFAQINLMIKVQLFSVSH